MAAAFPIQTDRLRIVPFTERHLTPRYVQWLNDPEVVLYSEQRHKVHTLDSCREYWHSFDETPNHFWALEEESQAFRHIGNMNAYVDVPNQVADVGILVGERDAQKKGYGSEAWIAVCRYLLMHLGLRKVCAGTMSCNEGMVKIMLRAGMIEDGRRKRHLLLGGKEVDVVHMALFGKSPAGSTGA